MWCWPTARSRSNQSRRSGRRQSGGIVAERTQVWSCGGGTQSAAIAALIIQGRLPKPDIALMVDTGRERESTWSFLNSWIKPSLREVGVDLCIISKEKYAGYDLYSHADGILLPGFSTQSGGVGKLSNFCSDKWKREVTSRYLRDVGVEQARLWIGISLDEMRRVRTQRLQWLELWYPLIFAVQMTRPECRLLALCMGWPEPPHSCCWMCPNMGDAEWLDMKVNWPHDFAQACALELEIRQRDAHFWLNARCIPLGEIDFTVPITGPSDQFALFGCASGHCFV